MKKFFRAIRCHPILLTLHYWPVRVFLTGMRTRYLTSKAYRWPFNAAWLKAGWYTAARSRPSHQYGFYESLTRK